MERATQYEQDKHRTSTGQAGHESVIASPEIQRLVRAIAGEQLSAKAIMANMQLKGRDNFLSLYLNPAIDFGFVSLLYPEKPRHSGQKYFLTAKGLAFLDGLAEKK